MIRTHEKVDNNQNVDSMEDLPILSQDQTSFLADTVILSSNSQSDDSQTFTSDLSQNSSDLEDNTSPIDYSIIREKCSDSDSYSSARSHEDIGLTHSTNTHGNLERQFPETRSNIDSLQSNNSGLKSELMYSRPELDSLNDYTGCFIPSLKKTIMKTHNKQTIVEEEDDIKRKLEKSMENIRTYEVEKRELNSAKQKLAKKRKILSEEKILFNSSTTLLAKELRDIQTNINVIQRSHDDLSKFCSKSEKILRQNKIKLEEIKTRLDMFQKEDCRNNFAYTTVINNDTMLASISTLEQTKRSRECDFNITESFGADEFPNKICQKRKPMRELQKRATDSNDKNVAFYLSAEEEARLKAYLDDYDL